MTKEKTVTIPLEFPVELADRKLDAVSIRRPIMGDLEDFPVSVSTGLKEEMALVAHLCNLHAEDLRRMDAEDYGKLQMQLLLVRGVSFDKRNRPERVTA